MVDEEQEIKSAWQSYVSTLSKKKKTKKINKKNSLEIQKDVN